MREKALKTKPSNETVGINIREEQVIEESKGKFLNREFTLGEKQILQ